MKNVFLSIKYETNFKVFKIIKKNMEKSTARETINGYGDLMKMRMMKMHN